MTRPRARVLILGGTGMLGGMLWSRLSSRPELSVRRSQRRTPGADGYFDALAAGDGGLTALVAADGGADFIVNALGLTKPEIREDDAASARAGALVNAELPKRLAALGPRVIHISTDGVFSGRSGPYDESSIPDPADLYGKTKLAGEVSHPRVLTVRCSVVGPDPEKGRGLFEWFRALGPDGAAKGFTDQLWNGVTTAQFADLCGAVIERGVFDALTAVSPVRHFCPNPPVTKHELLKAFACALSAPPAVETAVSGASVNRVLKSRWSDLNALVPAPGGVATAVREMLAAEPALRSSL